ncbi:hypothetical protein LNT71_004089 [Salmonella enterica]|nr:hypothetical protein [Salmonella enterica]
MKRYHVISISVLIGFISGLTVMGAKAFSVQADSATTAYQCLNGFKVIAYEKADQTVINLNGKTFLYAGSHIEGINQYQAIGLEKDVFTVRELGGKSRRVTGLMDGKTFDTICE